jgi:hypothetical protein
MSYGDTFKPAHRPLAKFAGSAPKALRIYWFALFKQKVQQAGVMHIDFRASWPNNSFKPKPLRSSA